MQEEHNKEGMNMQSDLEHVGNDLMGVVNEDLAETELSTEVLDILPSTEVEEEGN
jgi:uncharacterized protein (DUF2267 family)